jgi:hypothetical protein
MRFSQQDQTAVTTNERRAGDGDRRARTRNGRRSGETGKAWYRKGRLWLAAVSLVYVGWRRIFSRTRTRS